MTVRIITDSTCDLPAELTGRLGITVVPLRVIWGDEALRDGVDIDADTFYTRLVASKVHPRTSQPLVEDFVAAYEAAGADGDEIVSIHISSRLSGTLNSAQLAREEVSHSIRIEIIDSYNVSLALGGIVLEAAEAAARDATLQEVAAVARKAMESVRLLAVLDTLEYLRKGGRIGRASSLIGSVLSIKPLIHVEDGEIAPFERVRTRAKAVDRLVELAMDDRNAKRLFVACAGNDDEARALVERLRPSFPHTEFVVGHFGPVVGVYTGPSALGVGTMKRF